MTVKNPLALRLLLYLVIFSAFISLLGTTILFYRYYHRDLDAVYRQFELVSDGYNESISNSVWSFDSGQLKAQMTGILSFRDISYVSLETTDNYLLSVGTLPPENQRISHDIILTYNNKKPVVVGTLNIVADASGLKERLKDDILAVFVNHVLVFFVIAVFAFILLHKMVARHLTMMADYAQGLDIDHLDKPLVLNRKHSEDDADEIDVVVHAINRMRENLKSGVERQVKSEQEQKQLTQALQVAQKMDAIGTLASGIAHDFNNILGAIIGYAELAYADLPHEPDTRDMISQILRAGNRARGLIKQILRYSRGADGKKELVYVDKILCEVLTLMRSSLPATIRIDSHIPELSSPVLADSNQIHQVLMNLCANAFHAMKFKPEGVLTIRISDEMVHTEEKLLSLGIKAGAYIRLSVADTGVGIPPSEIDRVFDPYFSTKPKEEGTGLGLAVVFGIIKSLGGGIAVESVEGAGSQFDLFLPYAPDQNNFSETDSEPDENMSHPQWQGRALIVDDESMLVEVGAKLLQRLGLSCDISTHPMDVVKKIKATPDAFDLVVTDLTMPDITGDALAEVLKKIKPDLKIILTSGYIGAWDDIDDSRAALIDGFLLKPISEKDLCAVIDQVGIPRKT